MLEESLKICIVCTCHPTCKSIHSFIQCQIKDGDGHSFPVILSEIVDSDVEKSRRGKTREWIRFFFIQHEFFLFLLFFSVKLIQHFIQHDIVVMLDEMLDRFNKAFRKFLSIHREKNLRRSLSLNKVASLNPDTLLKETPAKLFS